MTKLDELLNIACLAALSKDVDDAYGAFVKSFPPRLIEKMLAEIKASRDAIDSEHDGDEYHEAREAFDHAMGAV